MLVGEIIRVALEALRANKLRSLLTMLGIIIGVGAVITMIALGSGAQKSVQDRIQALGPTLLSVYPGQSFMRGVASDQRVSLTMDDDTALANNARFVTAVVPELSRSLQVQKGNLNINSAVIEGTINGNVTAKDRIEMKSSARMTGDIKSKRLSVEDGVTFIGRSEVNPSGAASPIAATPVIEAGEEKSDAATVRQFARR